MKRDLKSSKIAQEFQKNPLHFLFKISVEISKNSPETIESPKLKESMHKSKQITLNISIKMF